MIIEFTVGNYLSFKDKKALSLEATAIKDIPDNVIDVGGYRLLKSAVIYGANSSGKSNLLKAIAIMIKMVLESVKESSTGEFEIEPFLLSTETANQPSFFEILFLIDGVRYRYGFEADKKIIHAEWLFECNGNTEKNLFTRNKNVIEITTDFEEGNGIEEKTRDNALFLSVVDQFNGPTAKKIIHWFSNQKVFSGLEHEKMKLLTTLYLNSKLENHIKNFLGQMDLGFKDFELEEFSIDKTSSSPISTLHNKYDELGKIVDKYKFDLLKQESSGTNKLYDIAGMISSSFINGSLIVIDELDAKLHPLLTMTIVGLFNSTETNKYGAQLIFATHYTNLLSSESFRRDQIWFTEKNHLEATDLYSLVEYREPDGKKVRNDRSFEKDYIAGRYGAIPFVGNFSKLVESGANREN